MLSRGSYRVQRRLQSDASWVRVPGPPPHLSAVVARVGSGTGLLIRLLRGFDSLRRHSIGDWCNGSTPRSERGNPGSNPGSPTIHSAGMAEQHRRRASNPCRWVRLPLPAPLHTPRGRDADGFGSDALNVAARVRLPPRLPNAGGARKQGRSGSVRRIGGAASNSAAAGWTPARSSHNASNSRTAARSGSSARPFTPERAGSRPARPTTSTPTHDADARSDGRPPPTRVPAGSNPAGVTPLRSSARRPAPRTG